MRHYAVEDEVRLGLGRDLRDWRKAGLLTPDQEQALRADVATDLRRAGIMLRLGLAAFTAIAGGAAIGLVFLVTNMRSEVAVSITAAVLGAAAFGAVDGVRRSLQVVSPRRGRGAGARSRRAMGLQRRPAGVGGLQHELRAVSAWFFAMAAVAAACAATYRRFGFQYAAVGAVYATALLPMASSSVDVEFKRIFAALVCAAAYVYASRVRRRADDDVTRSDAEVIRAAAAVGAYLAVNSLHSGRALRTTRGRLVQAGPVGWSPGCCRSCSDE